MDLEQKAIERIRTASELSLHYYKQPLICTYSGGKDSDVMLELFKRSGVPFEVVHGLTTVDAPQTVRHVKEVFRELENNGIKATIKRPEMSMWRLIEKRKGPPTRLYRYCCKYFKETSTPGRFIATGTRWAESKKREKTKILGKRGEKREKHEIILVNDNEEKRAVIENCKIKSEMIVNPIIDWPDKEIWEYYWGECKIHNELYKMGYCRVGCIGCPMAERRRWKQFADFPTYERAYKRAFEKVIEERKKAGMKERWKSGEELFRWWMQDDTIEGQMDFSDFPEIMPEE